MDSLSHLLTLLAPRCEVNLHCRFGGRWQAGHDQMRAGVVPWHFVLRGEGRLTVGHQTRHMRAGDVILLPHGSPHLMESLVEWGQVLPVAHRFNGTLTEVRTAVESDALEMLCGEFYFGPHVDWLFAEESALIHLHTDEREDCPELDILLNVLVRESLAEHPGGSAIVRSLGDTLLVLLLRTLLGAQEPPGGLLRLMSDARLMPAVLAVLAAPEQPWTIESMAARAFLSRATFARHFARVYHLTPQAWLSQLRMAMAARLLHLDRQVRLEVIAERCGFQSQASFAKTFKKHYGMTPGEWRRH
ncbi:AraC family transcriptional regulator [Klebsiella aerogenes]|uniref:AraC family transcriptional regulator n=1 Tax=Klebsiella TaxID=570 RepID=UPI0025C77EEA|nr:cupin domain-containing protein [Klebsiella aerogenes]